jgi:hypothetical protein
MPPQEHQVDSSKDEGEQAPILSLSRHLLKPNGSILGREVADCILPQFPTFASAIPTNLTARPALGSIDGREPITHARIHDFLLKEFGPSLHKLGFGKGDRIALVLPNGPELALAIVATAQWASCVPLSANGAHSELEADLLRCGADLVIGPYSGPLAQHESPKTDKRFNVMESAENNWDVFQHVEESAKKLGIPFVGLMPSPSDAGIFKLVPTRSEKPLKFADAVDLKPFRRNKNSVQTIPNSADDEVLVGYYWKQEVGAPFDGQYAHGRRHHLLELGPYTSRCQL